MKKELKKYFETFVNDAIGDTRPYIDPDDIETMVHGAISAFFNRVYSGEGGRHIMKNEIKEIMHACGDEFDFLELINEAKEELKQDAWESQQENMIQQ